MFHTLRDMRQRLADDTVILPGHNYATKPTSTLGEQKDGNPFLHFEDLSGFVRYRMHYHDQHREEPYGPVCKGHAMPD